MDPGLCVDIMKFIGPPICKYWSYHRKLKENSNILKSKKDDLNIRKENVELKLKSELHFGKIADKEVENWLKKVERIVGEIESLEDKVSKVGCLSRAFLGKQICEKIEETDKVYEEGNFSKALVMDAPSNSGMPLPTPQLVGETTVREKIWGYLMGDSVFKIGVCGMGGIGKTTIMKHIHNDLLGEAKFDKVIWVTVSQDFDVFKLQKEIALSLSEDLSKCEDKTKRAAMLSRFLVKTKRFVLILDDVWKRFHLEDVGIPEPSISNGCKLVLTTRSIELALSIGCKTIDVVPLSEGDALNLFLKHSGHEVIGPTLESTLKQVVKECAGLPLAIVTIGSSMRGEDKVEVWKNALYELQGHAGKAEEVFERLKFSYDRLPHIKLKQCFLYCALYPEDFEISKEELIEYWIVEGLMDERKTRQDMCNQGHAILTTLENHYLLEKGGKKECVKMHDLVRDLALHITNESPRYLVKAGMQLEELPDEQEWKEDLEKVSLIQNNVKEIPSNVALPKCKALTTLWLQYNSLKRIDESFFMLMTGLKILDLSNNHDIKALPNSVSELENLNALLLRDCWRLEYVPSLSKLTVLKKLDLGGTGIEEVPHGMETLVHLTYLDLNTRKLQEVPAGILPKLSRLQHLSLDCTPALVMEEVAALRKLEFLRISFENLQDYDHYLSRDSRLKQGLLNRYILRVGVSDHRPRTTCEKSVEFATLRFSGHSIRLPTDIQDMYIHGCHDLRNLSDHDISATDLRYCQISFCERLECLVSSSSCYHILQSIEALILLSLNNLQVIFRGERDIAVSALLTPTPLGIFSHLKYIQIMYCPKMKKLFWPDLMHNLQNLEEIYVYRCEQLVEIIGAWDDNDENKEEGRKSMVFALPQLRKMKLEFLPQLECICKSGSLMECNSLEAVQIYSCPKLKRIPFLLPQLENGQLRPPVSLRVISAYPKEWWNSLEWDHPNIQNVLQPYVRFKRSHDILRPPIVDLVVGAIDSGLRLDWITKSLNLTQLRNPTQLGWIENIRLG